MRSAARLRLGAKTASILYRRTEAEMPARVEEVHHAKDEGVRFEMLVNPVEFLGDEKGNLKSVIAPAWNWASPTIQDAAAPSPIKGSEFETPCSVAIIAAGTSANPLIQSSTPGLQVTKRGYIAANDDTLATSKTGSLRGWRHRDWRRNGDPGHGRRTQGRQIDQRISASLNGAAVATAKAVAD